MKHMRIIESPEEYSHLFGCPPPNHRLIGLWRIDELCEAKTITNPVRIDLYTIIMSSGNTGHPYIYGQNSYNSEKGGMSFFAPGQTHRYHRHNWKGSGWGWILSLHPALLNQTSLSDRLRRVRLFSYATDRSIPIDKTAAATFDSIFSDIEREYRNRFFDEYSKEIIISLIELLISNVMRYAKHYSHELGTYRSDIMVKAEQALHSMIVENEYGNCAAWGGVIC